MCIRSTNLTQPDLVRLYRHAFKKYRMHALWNKRVLAEPAREDAPVVARTLLHRPLWGQT
jgi:hypothetical protein